MMIGLFITNGRNALDCIRAYVDGEFIGMDYVISMPSRLMAANIKEGECDTKAKLDFGSVCWRR